MPKPRVVALEALPLRNPSAFLRELADRIDAAVDRPERVAVVCQYAGPPVDVYAVGPGDALTIAGVCLAGAAWLVRTDA